MIFLKNIFFLLHCPAPHCPTCHGSPVFYGLQHPQQLLSLCLMTWSTLRLAAQIPPDSSPIPPPREAQVGSVWTGCRGDIPPLIQSSKFCKDSKQKSVTGTEYPKSIGRTSGLRHGQPGRNFYWAGGHVCAL